jgi:hypothetical protein
MLARLCVCGVFVSEVECARSSYCVYGYKQIARVHWLGPVTAAQKALLLCRADMLPTTQRMHRQKKAESPTCQCCRIGAAETLEHAVLLCPAHESLRKDMWDALVDIMGWRCSSC